VVSGGVGKDRLLRVRDTPLFSVFNSACFVAGASAVIGGASWVLTFTTWTSFMSSSYFVPFFALAFPLLGWSVLVVNMRHPEWRRGWRLGRRQRQHRAREQQAALLTDIPRGCGSRLARSSPRWS
jgi:hypothetical protein